jgi:hypothetical protein
LFIPQGKFEMKILKKKLFLKFELNFFLNLENNLAIPQEGNGKIWKKINFEI